jgi:hypothetical protein
MKKLLGVLVVLLGVGAAAAYHFGYLERLAPWLPRTRFIPKDPALLAYFASDSRELLLVQSTELDVRLPPEDQARMEQKLEEFRVRTGIRVREDVDAIALGSSLLVVRGRFDWSQLSTHLVSDGYTLQDVRGAPAALKNSRTDVVLDGRYLLIGSFPALDQALLRKHEGGGLREGSPLVQALEDIGWKHALVGGMVSGSQVESLSDAMLKSVRSLVGAVDLTPAEFTLSATAVTGSREQAEALRATLELLRATAMLPTIPPDRKDLLTARESLRAATLEADVQGRLRGAIRFPTSLVEDVSAHFTQYSLPPALQGLGASTPGGPATVPPAVQAPVPATPALTPRVDWKPPVLGVVLLTLLLLTMGARARPGLFNILFHPLFLLPFLVASLGVFVLRWTPYTGGALDVLQLPLPEWSRLLPWSEARTVGASAALPLVFALLSAAASWLRRFAAGLGVGVGAWLAVAALAPAPLPLIPPAYTLYWYAGNALLAVVLARLALPPRRQAEPSRPSRSVHR